MMIVNNFLSILKSVFQRKLIHFNPFVEKTWCGVSCAERLSFALRFFGCRGIIWAQSHTAVMQTEVLCFLGRDGFIRPGSDRSFS